MIIVLDASAGIEIALSRASAELYERKIEKASKVITSELYKAETANVLWKYINAGLLSKEEVQKRLKYCDDLIDEYVDISENNEEALNEGIRIKHSVYDLLYLVIARRNGAILLTQDKKLKKIAKESGVEIE
jgi:predicted nucleic acid-binding protein